MVSFRKLFPVLAVIALLATVATASAQSVACDVSSTQPAIRAEGLTEPVGTITLTCKSGATGIPAGVTANFRVASNGPNITNNVDKNNVITTDAAGVTMTVQDVAAKTTGGSTVAGVLDATGKNIDWSGVALPFDAAATTITIKITGVRVNAQQTGGAFSNVTFSTFGFASNAGNFTLGLNQSSVTVAQVQKGVNFATTAFSGTSTSCGAISSAPTVTSSVVFDKTNSALVTFTPNFPNAIQVNNQLVANFTVPTGATLYVAGTNLDPKSSTFVAPVGGNVAVLDTKATGSQATFVKQAAPSSGNTIQVIWTVTAASANDAYVFPVAITYGAQAVNPGSTVTVTGGLGPIVTGDAAGKASVPDSGKPPVPRFADVTTGQTPATLFTISSCQTTLLFPYVVTNTSATGPAFDTGIAITNPTADVLTPNGKYLFSGGSTASAGQPGKCTLYFQGTGAPATATVTTANNIAAGSTYAFLASAGTESSGTAANFTGYVLAQCNFANAQGFAYIFDSSKTTNLGAMGYLAVKQ